jgi:hypothetical protein
MDFQHHSGRRNCGIDKLHRNKRMNMAVRVLPQKMKRWETEMEESGTPFHDQLISEILRSE